MYEGEIKLHLEYKMNEIGYVYSNQTSQMFQQIASWIMSSNVRRIVEPGCGIAHINEFLKGYDYTYVGIDTCPNQTKFAQKRWKDHNNIKIIQCDWRTLNEKYTDYDCLLLQGVLPYGLPEYGYHDNVSPMTLYDRFVEMFDPRKVFIRETLQDQEIVAVSNKLKTVDMQPFIDMADSTVYVDNGNWLGKKVLLNVTRKQTQRTAESESTSTIE